MASLLHVGRTIIIKMTQVKVVWYEKDQTCSHASIISYMTYSNCTCKCFFVGKVYQKNMLKVCGPCPMELKQLAGDLREDSQFPLVRCQVCGYDFLQLSCMVRVDLAEEVQWFFPGELRWSHFREHRVSKSAIFTFRGAVEGVVLFSRLMYWQWHSMLNYCWALFCILQ